MSKLDATVVHPNNGDIELGLNGYSKVAVEDGAAAIINPAKAKKDICWDSIDFTVGDKKILSKCWGKVFVRSVRFV